MTGLEDSGNMDLNSLDKNYWIGRVGEVITTGSFNLFTDYALEPNVERLQVPSSL